MFKAGGPDWVVLGTPTADGKVAVYASRDLTEAELHAEVDEFTRGPLCQRRPISRRIELKVGMRTYTVVAADTYEDALRILFNHWSPDSSGEQPAIGDIRRQLAAGGDCDA